ncbi:hypothetical protein [Phosphitispora sp. TUW77]|uniref:hypothetical protein n=1 Tax=Phosphitispora sp. TUW77 TaxID=3152361 RepID=UPI003AB6A4A5
MQRRVVHELQTAENEQVSDQPDSPSLHIIKKNVETETKVEWTVTAYYWCRVCKQKTPVTEAKSCDCGVTMCNLCWAEWDFICPICESYTSR